MTDEAVRSSNATVDKAGAVCSTVCAVHCAATAALPGVVAALGLGAMVAPALEWGFTVVAILLATTALVLGWRRHRLLWVSAILVAGIAGLATGRLLETAHVHGAGMALSIGAGLTLAVGHIISIRVSRSRALASSATL